ncbi:MAG: tail completion protein gp17 [Sphingopyxis sp.]|uniref:tail completion protein gp17 n=1 Tax=Sphingopyxis sp. TaxID=1908224 RepID=UPI003D6CC2A2
MSAERAVRARALAMLADDVVLAGLVHGVFDGVPARASPPYVSVVLAEGSDWGTKDAPGREVRVTLALVGVGDAAADKAAAQIEALVPGLRGAAGAWRIVGARVVRTRFGFAKDGGWRHEIVVRCRCLVG